ncbi:acyltransferase family protein [Pantoea sp. MBD-2R]|uniref:acyltransferase n=1 Tax=unclassified Pantoea TaxID=2630326 RepID=UPI0020C49A95|nr:acyltransferase family protein [Pantoea sp. CCBC3-3-1]
MKTINIKLLTLLATFLVILLHTAAIPFSYFHAAWSVSVMYEALGRIAFPLFLLIAGFVSLNKNESLLSTLKTRVLDLVIPLVVWSAIYLVYNQQINGSSAPVSLLELLSTPAYPHLWFVYTMILLYLVTPLLNTFIQNGSQQRVNYTLTVWFVLASVYMLFDNVKANLLEGQALPVPSNIDMVVYLSGFYIIGGVVRRFDINPKVIISAIIFILSAVLTAVMTYSLSISTFAPNQVFLFYSAPTIVVVSLACFFMLLNAPFAWREHTNNAIHSLSRLSIGIFFVHPIVLETLLKTLHIEFEGYYSALTIPLVALVCFAISAVIVWLLRQVRWVRRIAP